MTGINYSHLGDDRKLVEEMDGCTPVVTLGYLGRAGHCVKLVDLDGRIGGVSENGLCAMEVARKEAVIGLEWWVLWPENMRHVLRNAVTRSRLGEVVRFVGNCPTMNKWPKLWDVTVSPMRDRHGRIVRLLVVSREMGNAKAS